MAYNDGTCLYARGLPASCRAEDIDAMFRQHGRVASVRMPLEPSTKAHRGYAFVTMEHGTDAQSCIAALNGVEFCGCRLLIEVSKRAAPHIKTPGVYCGRSVSPPQGRRSPLGGGASGAACRGYAERPPSPRGAGSRQLRGGGQRHLPVDSGSCALAEPLCEPASAAAAPSSSGKAVGAWGRPRAVEPQPSAEVAEPAFEPGGEPLIEEDPAMPSEGKRIEHARSESPRSRIRRLEEANVKAVGKQTADALLLQFQQQGFLDPRAAALECLGMSMELLGEAPSRAAISALASPYDGPRPAVLLSPDEFKNPSSFLRVYGDPVAAAAPRCGQPERHQDGNWRCEQCGNVNYPRRQRCHKCQATRGPAGDAIVLQYCLRVHETLQKGRAAG